MKFHTIRVKFHTTHLFDRARVKFHTRVDDACEISHARGVRGACAGRRTALACATRGTCTRDARTVRTDLHPVRTSLGARGFFLDSILISH